jgi:DNA-binding transcriptional MocR family regulator
MRPGPLDQATIDRAVDASQGIGDVGRAVYQAIASYALSEAVCWPSQQTIADDLGIKRVRVSRAVGRLERAGWLSKSARLRGRYGWTFLVYELLHAWAPVPEWVRQHIVQRAQRRVLNPLRTNSRGTSAKVREGWVPPTLKDVMRAIATAAQRAGP